MKKILQFNLKYYWFSPIILCLASILGLSYARHLKINLDLAGLLPSNSSTIREMNHVVEKVGGGGYLLVVIGPMTNPEKTLPGLSESLKNLPGVKYSYYEREEYMMKDKALYIMPKNDFKKLAEYAQILFSDHAVDTSGLGLVEESDRDEQLKEAHHFFDKLKKLASKGQYFMSEDKRYAMLLVRPNFDSTDLGKSTELKDQINKVMGSKIPFSLSGRYVEKAMEQEEFQHDIAFTGLISNVLITILLVWGLGTFRGAVMTAFVVILAMGVASGLGQIFVGQINILTGFLLAILSGIGSKFGIHLIRRFYQEISRGHHREIAIRNTYFALARKGLFSSALTASCSFLILSISKFRGFSELGIFAGTGIIVMYLFFVALFPLMAKALPINRPKRFYHQFYLGKYPVNIQWIKGIWLVIPFIIWGLFSAYFEYDFEKLHNFPPEIVRINKLTDKIFGREVFPSAILARDKEQVLELSEWLRDDEQKETIDQVVSLYDLVPPDMEKRSRKIAKLKSYVTKISATELESKAHISKDQIDKWLDTRPYSRSYIPQAIDANFGVDGNILLVFPKEKQSSYGTITRYAKKLEEAREKFPGMEVGSDTLVFAEILYHIIHDGKLVIGLFLLGAFAIFWLDFKKFNDAIILEIQLLLCIVVLVSLMGIFRIPFTILNVAMIPEVLAAGIDMGVHIRHRQKEGHTSLESAELISHAVNLGAFTSILGFGSLLIANSSMLRGIAWISILGQVSSYFICLILFPLIFSLWPNEKFKVNLLVKKMKRSKE